jgi:23S rRNA (guanine2445-N2)-methyltransferase
VEPEFFATAAKGTEPALRDELRELGLRDVRADRGGVHFAGPAEDGWRACLWSRVALRILARVASFDAPDEDALYEGVRGVDWRHVLTSRLTLAVRASCKDSKLTHTQYIAQRTKDAVVDQLRDLTGARPSVDREDPDVGLFVHLVRNHADVYMDLSGESLHRRGWRPRIGQAPLKETLAAAVVRLSGWDRRAPFLDPMCGAGTIAIEAASWAQGVAPGLGRARFGFERWASFDPAMRRKMADLRAEASAARAPRGQSPRVVASDVDERAVELARANAADAGVDLEMDVKPLADLRPLTPPGFVVTNPPYGERLAVGPDFYAEMARVFARMHGHTVAVLAGTPQIARAMRLRPAKTLVLYNGDLECRLLTYAIP